jgi:FkbM family methyltransferase
MLIKLDDLISRYNIDITGIIHVGAHECEEIVDYDKYIKRDKILWIEAQQDKVLLSLQKYENIIIEQAVVSDKIELVTFNVANNGQSSSILEFDLHQVYYPYIQYIRSYEVQTTTLDILIEKYNEIPFNFINLDIQGAELTALKGMEEYLNNIEYVYTEVNKKSVYKNCAIIEEIDEYLNNYGFYRVETVWTAEDWGDAFYIKKKYSPVKKSVIFKPSGRLGNAIFRYLASTVLCMKYDMNFILHDAVDYTKIKPFEYYPGVDHVDDDIEFTGYSSLNSLIEYVNKNDKIVCFNTLGYLKNKCDLLNLTTNDWINTNTNHGLYVKNITTITDDNYFDMVDTLKDRNTNIIMDGYFQFDYLYLKNKSEILQFINANKNEHYIQTDTNHRFLMKDIIDNMELPISKIYDIVIHIRLGDFNGRPDFIEYEYYEKLFQTIDFTNKRVCILLEPVNSESDLYFLNRCSEWFNKNTDITKITITIESNDLMTDFNIMKQTKTLICSMSTLSWSAAYFSTILETCYMPNYDFSKLRNFVNFKKPIENTILYTVKTTPDYITENMCEYGSSRGLLKSCNVKSTTPYSSIQQLINYDFSKIIDGNTIYICSNAIPSFIKILDQINHKIILVSGDCDETVPDDLFTNTSDFLQFIENDKIIHWFSQNWVGSHPKVTGIPIGLDYHTISNNDGHEWGNNISPGNQEQQLIDIKNNSLPFWKRTVKCYSNFHFFTTTKFGYDRIDAIDKINKDLVEYEPNKIKRIDTWKNQSNYAFVISPHGNGLDCHRTWEALCLGCIPIVKSSKLDYLYSELPVLIVDNWSDITAELLMSTIKAYTYTIFNYDKLKLQFWVQTINNINK